MPNTLPKPDVTVTEVFQSSSPSLIRPLLEGCMVGPCFQILTQVLGGKYVGSLLTIPYPQVIQGALVSVPDTKVYLQQGTDQYDVTTEVVNQGGSIGATTIVFPAAFIPSKVVRPQTQVSPVVGTTFTDPKADFVLAGIKPGDILTFVTAGPLINPDSVLSAQVGNFTVLNVISPTQLEVTPALISETKVEYLITRFGTSTGDILVSYKARRVDGVNVFFEHQTLEEAIADLGPAVPSNPLCYAVAIALLHTSSVVASTMVGGDNVTDYEAALEFLESKDVYGLVPLTQDPSVHQAFQQHVDRMSQPQNKSERIALVSEAQIPLIVYQDDSVTGSTAAGSATFTDANGKFVTNGVPVGSILVFDSPQMYGGVPVSSVPVLAVISETQLLTSIPANNLGLNITYSVESRPFTTFQKALNLQKLGQAYNDRRVVEVQPDIAEVTFDGTQQDIPGYFLAAAVAGLISGSSPSQGFTNWPFAGFVGLKNSNLTYSELQLDMIDAGGIFMFIQEVPGAPVTPRHQLTTAVGTIQTRELSIVKTVDFVAKVIRNQIRSLIGINNITDAFLNNILKPQTNGIINNLVQDRIIGPNTKITGLSQSVTQPDSVEVSIQLEVLYPVNYINYTLII